MLAPPFALILPYGGSESKRREAKEYLLGWLTEWPSWLTSRRKGKNRRIWMLVKEHLTAIGQRTEA